MSIPLTQELFEERFDELLRTVKEGFDTTASKVELDEVKTDLAGVKTDLAGVKTDLVAMRATMVTKDYLDERLGELKGDLVVKLRKEDTKVDFLISLLRARSILTDEDIRRFRSEYQVFPSLN